MKILSQGKGKKIFRKIRSKKGLTVIELLCATLIMVIVAGIMALGVRLGTTTYGKTVSASEAKELCSAVCEILNDELRSSGSLYVDANDKTKVVGLHSKSFGGGDADNLTTFYVGGDGHLYFGNKDTPEDSLNVLGEKSYAYNTKLELSIKVDNDAAKKTNIFKVSVTVFNASGDTTLALSTFDVKQLNYHSPEVVGSIE